MFDNMVLAAAKLEDALFVVAMGIGTVFIGLVSIVFICMLMSLICGGKKKTDTAESATPATVPVQNQVIENRQEIIAAVTAAIAEDMGTDVTGIRVLSFKKL